MSLPEQKQIAAGSFKLSDGRQAYLAKAKNNFPHVSQLSSKSPPTFDGTPDEFLESFKDENEKKEIAKRLKNKVRKCPNCGKAVAFTLSNCNSCGESLKEVDISYTNNVFTGFAYGVKKGPFPFTISLRYQDEDFMVFDDLLGLSPCHVNVIPTSQYMSDWRFLLKNPAKGLKLINTMHDLCLKVMREQFVSSKEWCEKILPKDAPKGDALERMVLSGFNYPPSQYQLHLQFMLPPLLPFQSFNYEKGLHFTPGRFFPIQYVRALLSLDVVFEVDDDTDINDIIKKAKELGVDYEKIHAEFYKNAGLHQSTLGNWNLNDFESVVVVDKDDKNELFSIEKDGSLKKIESEEDIKSIPNVDKSVLQNYGRPYNEDGKTTGTYYKHAKRKASDMHNW